MSKIWICASCRYEEGLDIACTTVVYSDGVNHKPTRCPLYKYSATDWRDISPPEWKN